eukprot:4853165-Pleurochrysis_carterae.AAC.9
MFHSICDFWSAVQTDGKILRVLYFGLSITVATRVLYHTVPKWLTGLSDSLKSNLGGSPHTSIPNQPPTEVGPTAPPRWRPTYYVC